MLRKPDPAEMIEQNRENELAGDDEANQLACAEPRSEKNIAGEIDRAHQAAGDPGIPWRGTHHFARRPFRGQRPGQDRGGDQPDDHIDGGRDVVIAERFSQQRVGRDLRRQHHAEKDRERREKPAHDMSRSGSAR